MRTDQPDTAACPTPTRRPWSATAERMRRTAESHADSRVREYAKRWLVADAKVKVAS